MSKGLKALDDIAWIVVDRYPFEDRYNNIYLNDIKEKEVSTIRQELEEYEEYKRIEEELGIDLITLFNALKDGIYYRNLIGGICHVLKVDLSYYSKYSNKPEVLCLVEREDDYDEQIIAHYLFKDYGKTWALTKEELTDGK